jgi:hypothetical protein
MPSPPQSRAHRFQLSACAARVFPLFTVLGERAWVPGWDPEVLSGAEERGSVFRTIGDDGIDTTWIVIAYEPQVGRIGYARLKDGSNVGLVDVECRDHEDGCEVGVRYTLTATTPDGETFVHDFLDDERYKTFIEGWGRRIADVLSLDSATSV